jgi:hypothetical protein
MSYVRPSRLDLCDDFFVRMRRHWSPERQLTSDQISNRGAAYREKSPSILRLSPTKPLSTTSRSAFSSPRSWRGDEPILPPQEYWFPFLPSGTSPCRSTPRNIVASSPSRKESPRKKKAKSAIPLTSPRRVPNEQQLPRWLRREDAPWNPPTYTPQLTPGALPHFVLESDLLRTPRSVSRRWKSMSATPQRLPSAGGI